MSGKPHEPEIPEIKQTHVKEHVTAGIFVLTISDTRTLETDKTGDLMIEWLEVNRHDVIGRGLVPDEPREIERLLKEACENPAVNVILTSGGTGIGPRDTTFETLQGRIERPIPGFGELFRMLSYEEIGSPAMVSRALGGLTAENKLIFAVPGSSKGARLALEKLILPEIGHLLREIKRQPGEAHSG